MAGRARLTLSMLQVGAAMLIGTAMPARAAGPASFYQAMVDDYFHASWAAHPVAATGLGLHDHDDRIDDVSAAAFRAESRRLHTTLGRLRGIDGGKLSALQRDDRAILQAEIGGALLELDTVQSWRHNPDFYVGLATNSVYVLIARAFALPQTRLRAVIAREQAIPHVLDAARTNLADMPAVFVEIALENAGGAESFLAHDVPAAFADLHDPALAGQLAASTRAAVDAMTSYHAWLQAQAKGAHGSFAYGAASFRALLGADMIDLTPQQVLDAGTAQLARDQAMFAATSARIDPAHPGQALAEVEHDHPDGAHLIDTAARQLEMVQNFVRAHHIVTLPSDALPVVRETPPFQRAEIFGEEDAPGPFEMNATKAYYYITPPDAADSAALQDRYLAYFNRSLLLNLTVHEAMPGHFVQFLFAQSHPGWSVVRKAATSYTATEGWAHYSEQMMTDEGLAGNDPKLRLAQTQDALLRDCRLIASVRMHTMGMTLAQAAEMMKTQCHQPDDVAYKEARRGTADPGYFSYTLGKLMIQKLRADVAAQKGARFSLELFHDDFLAAGLVPLAMIRRELTGHDGPLL